MALIVEDGSGKVNAESYISVADADTYFANHGDPVAWTSASVLEKEAALREATQYIDGMYTYRWRGNRDTADQALDWPRVSVLLTPNDYEVAANEVPVKVQHACAEAALLSITETSGLMPTVDDSSRVLREKNKVGELETDTTWLAGASGLKHFTKVELLVRRYLLSGARLDRA